MCLKQISEKERSIFLILFEMIKKVDKYDKIL